MWKLTINRYVNNLELLSKLMNSIAQKCNCRVKYNEKSNSINFTGNEKYKRFIVEETMSYLPRDK